ncbi:MAG: nucleoside phosphorylase [Candidatus Lokiarchaeota archaeon]|nr:nucleoside phosphorylase [Candidatus Lokiarchaeota archaeon]
MTFPNFPNKYDEKPLLKAKDFWDYKKKIGSIPEIDPPLGVILCYSPTLLNFIINNHNVKKVEHVVGNFFYVLDEGDFQIGICGGFGIGGPIVGILLEELTAFGIKKFISIGVAGSLQTDLKLGSIIVCDKAIRDEGVSHHYLQPEKYAYPSESLTKRLVNTIIELNINYIKGATWTIDAPYRETTAEVKYYQKEGILTVEMEAASLFAVAQHLNVEAGAIFTISDYLSEDEWELHFHLTEEHLKKLFLIAKNTLMK